MAPISQLILCQPIHVRRYGRANCFGVVACCGGSYVAWANGVGLPPFEITTLGALRALRSTGLVSWRLDAK